MTREAFWKDFLEKTDRPADTPCYDTFYFDLTEKAASALAAMVLAGKKTASSSSLYAYNKEKGERPPRVGDLSVVTGFSGEPLCVIETVSVRVLPFSMMTYELCKAEGEDMSLEAWRAAHTRYFTEDGKNCGYVFSEDMPVVFETFRVVYPSGGHA